MPAVQLGATVRTLVPLFAWPNDIHCIQQASFCFCHLHSSSPTECGKIPWHASSNSYCTL